MYVLFSTYVSLGHVKPMVGLAVQSQGLRAELSVCVPMDRGQLPVHVRIPLIGVWQ